VKFGTWNNHTEYNYKHKSVGSLWVNYNWEQKAAHTMVEIRSAGKVRLKKEAWKKFINTKRRKTKKSIFCRAMRLQEKQSKKKQTHGKTLARKHNLPMGKKPKFSWQTVKNFKGDYKQQL
jgi:hypothetical protein